MPATRPAPDLPITPVTLVTRWGGLVATVVVALVAVGTYGSLPDQVPTHFSGAMEPDSFGPKWSILVVGAVLLVLSALMSWIAGHPQWFNCPTPVTPENAQAVYRAGATMMGMLGWALPLLYAGFVVAVHGGPALPLMIAGLVLLVGALVGGIWAIGRASRAEKTYRYGRGRNR